MLIPNVPVGSFSPRFEVGAGGVTEKEVHHVTAGRKQLSAMTCPCSGSRSLFPGLGCLYFHLHAAVQAHRDAVFGGRSRREV